MGNDFQFSVPQGMIVYRSAFDTPYGSFLVTLIRGEEHGNEQLAAGQSLHHGKYITRVR